jgi:hypothetical protein
MSVKVTTVDRRTIEVKFPAAPSELANALSGLADEGYEITDAATIQGGDQRDPYAIGVRIVATRGTR